MADMSTEWNNHLRDIQIPNTVYLSVVFLLGVSGNTFVLYVYTFKMKEIIEERYFIPVIALIDIIACLVSIPFYITVDLFWVAYPSGELCKFFFFMTTFSTGASAHVLFVISLQRYLKICRPTGKQMTLKWKRISNGIVVILSLIYAAPLLYYSDNMEISWIYQGENVTGVMCKMAARETGGSEFYYFALLSVLIIVNITATVAMYVPIGYVIYKRFKSMKDRKQRNNTNEIQDNIQIESSKSETRQSTFTSVEQSAHSNTECKLSEKSQTASPNTGNKLSEKTKTAQPKTEGKLYEKTHSAQPNTKGKLYEKTQTAKPNNESKVSEKTQTAQPNTVDKVSEKTDNAQKINDGRLLEKNLGKQQKQNRNVQVKANFNHMFFAIVLFYVISYIPTLIIMFLSQAFDNFWYNLSDSLFGFCAFLSSMFMLNHVVNPVIYGFFDMKFRVEMRRIFCSSTSRRRGSDLQKQK